MIGRGELPLSAVFRESFLRRSGVHIGVLRDFGDLLATLAGPPWTCTFEAAREQYRAVVREYRQAEEALRAVRTTTGGENRTFHLATIPVLRTMGIEGRELEMVRRWETVGGDRGIWPLCTATSASETRTRATRSASSSRGPPPLRRDIVTSGSRDMRLPDEVREDREGDGRRPPEDEKSDRARARVEEAYRRRGLPSPFEDEPKADDDPGATRDAGEEDDGPGGSGACEP